MRLVLIFLFICNSAFALEVTCTDRDNPSLQLTLSVDGGGLVRQATYTNWDMGMAGQGSAQDIIFVRQQDAVALYLVAPGNQGGVVGLTANSQMLVVGNPLSGGIQHVDLVAPVVAGVAGKSHFLCK